MPAILSNYSMKKNDEKYITLRTNSSRALHMEILIKIPKRFTSCRGNKSEGSSSQPTQPYDPFQINGT